jgi:hypothetical protein
MSYSQQRNNHSTKGSIDDSINSANPMSTASQSIIHQPFDVDNNNNLLNVMPTNSFYNAIPSTSSHPASTSFVNSHPTSLTTSHILSSQPQTNNIYLNNNNHHCSLPPYTSHITTNTNNSTNTVSNIISSIPSHMSLTSPSSPASNTSNTNNNDSIYHNSTVNNMSNPMYSMNNNNINNSTNASNVALPYMVSFASNPSQQQHHSTVMPSIVSTSSPILSAFSPSNPTTANVTTMVGVNNHNINNNSSYNGSNVVSTGLSYQPSQQQLLHQQYLYPSQSQSNTNYHSQNLNVTALPAKSTQPQPFQLQQPPNAFYQLASQQRPQLQHPQFQQPMPFPVSSYPQLVPNIIINNNNSDGTNMMSQFQYQQQQQQQQQPRLQLPHTNMDNNNALSGFAKQQQQQQQLLLLQYQQQLQLLLQQQQQQQQIHMNPLDANQGPYQQISLNQLDQLQATKLNAVQAPTTANVSSYNFTGNPSIVVPIFSTTATNIGNAPPMQQSSIEMNQQELEKQSILDQIQRTIEQQQQIGSNTGSNRNTSISENKTFGSSSTTAPDRLNFNPLTTLFIRDLSYFCTEGHLLPLFSTIGNVLDLKVKRGVSGESLLFGYVSFDDEETMLRAMQTFNGQEFMGRRLK